MRINRRENDHHTVTVSVPVGTIFRPEIVERKQDGEWHFMPYDEFQDIGEIENYSLKGLREALSGKLSKMKYSGEIT